MKSGIVQSRRSRKDPKRVLSKVLSKNIEALLAVPGRKMEKLYIAAARDAGASQTAVLMEIIRFAQNTVIGKRFDFASIDSYDAYRKQVPVMDYEELRPYVDRHVEGEADVLFPGKPMLYTRTSGTTAKPKLIPISPFNFERTIKNRGKLWLYGVAKQFPGVFSGKDFTLVSPAEDGVTEDGIPYGALSGLMYKNIPEFVERVHSIPYEVICIKDFAARAYTLLRFGVPQNVTAVFTGNPSTVLNLAVKVDEWKQELIRDIADGTLRDDIDLEPEIRASIAPLFKPARKRAAQLEKLVAEKARFLPTDYWPNVKVIHTWTNGNCALVIPELKQWYGDTPVLDFGYIASEITATDVVDAKTNGSRLALRSAFYEFSPFEEGDEPRTFLMAHQVEVGRKYYIYVTTYSGLYRYNMNDVIEVIDKYYEAPVIRFLFKGHGITSMQGEKLSESQLIDATRSAAEELGIAYGFFVAFANVARSQYEIFIELKGDFAGASERFAASLDAHLCRVNIEYESKRKTERLKAPLVRPLVDDAFDKYREIRLAEGAFEGQLKWLHLSADPAVQQRMQKLLR
ncbi:MAG: GH3 auxin-responsive promoter family protein [Deltaproteobacteria bacterium]|nr:GH3 auxin-responsive promoter family protein [Deltaproteobacteria bacterium]MBN2671052.1 GH3 auxin-responsive promoter family protein [Deltaproteobacteria bacterium]